MKTGRCRRFRSLQEPVDDIKIASAIEGTVNTWIPILPIQAEVGDSYDAGQLDAKVLTVTFNVEAGVEVVADHKLKREPTLCLMAAPSGIPGNSAVRAYLGSNQNLNLNTATQMQMDTESFDLLSEFDVSTYRYTALAPGVRQVSARASITGAATAVGYMCLLLYKNGALYSRGIHVQRAVNPGVLTDLDEQDGPMLVDLVDMDAGDYLDLYAYQNFINPTATINANSDLTYWGIKCIQGFEVSKGSTWDDEQVSFKCSGNTSEDEVTVKVVIA